MARQSVELYYVFALCLLLSCVGSWIIAHRYRRRVKQLMRAPGRGGGPSANATDTAVPEGPAGMPVSLAANRAAGTRLTLLLIASSCLAAATSASLFSALRFPNDPLTFWRVFPIAVLHVWPVIVAIALVWRWSRPRFFAALLLWCVGTWIVLSGIALWRQIDMPPLLLLEIMADEMGLSLLLLSLVFLGEATRAIAPWLLVPTALLAWSSLAGMRTMVSVGTRPSPLALNVIELLDPFLGWLPWYGVLLLFALLPWVLAWWPARVVGRALGRAYSRKWFSDGLAMYIAVWAFALTDRALTIAARPDVGAAALAMYLPLFWIPAVMWFAARWRPRSARAPTLLVLRVFEHDAPTRALFDHVVERWRLSGNTVMIAGTDLADRTLDADDIFQFLDRKLPERFIASPADVARRIAAFDMVADVDGRYRVNECYCHDTTWQDALQALVRRSDIALIDLRGFQSHNVGCRYELATLAQAPRALRVVALFDDRTDRELADEIVASGPPDRFTWIDAAHFNASKRHEVLAHLFA